MKNKEEREAFKKTRESHGIVALKLQYDFFLKKIILYKIFIVKLK
jgi:hypothetical protein